MAKRYTNTTWLKLSRFTKKGCHFDYMVGLSQYHKIKDTLSGRLLTNFETVFWNRTLNVNVSLADYMKLKDSKDPEIRKKMEEIGLPDDIVIR